MNKIRMIKLSIHYLLLVCVFGLLYIATPTNLRTSSLFFLCLLGSILLGVMLFLLEWIRDIEDRRETLIKHNYQLITVSEEGQEIWTKQIRSHIVVKYVNTQGYCVKTKSFDEEDVALWQKYIV